MSDFIDLGATALIPASIVLHLILAPYTKVEESFNIQAIHDITSYGVPFPRNASYVTEKYDHVDFPGAVPRTFIGALILSIVSQPLLAFFSSPTSCQLLVRGLLGMINAGAILGFRTAIKQSAGRVVANWYAVLQATQFHVMFYASRTLPNMFAFAITTLAMRNLVLAESKPAKSPEVKRQHFLVLSLLTIAGVIFRSELAVLVATQTVFLLLTNRASLRTVLPAGIAGLVIGLSLTVPIDSFFWQKFPIWPEWTSFYYNTILGQSSNWGTSPWHYYFANAIPRLLLNPLTYTILIPIAVLSPATRTLATSILIPQLSFIGIYSLMPHKEWRFVVYVIPGLTAVSAIGAAWIWNRRRKSSIFRILTLLLVASVAATFLASSILLTISRFNYPGGESIVRLLQIANHKTGPLHVYADNLACQSGVTRFLESRGETINGHRKWNFDKTENETTLLEPQFWSRFDYALVEKSERAIGKWEVADVVTGLDGLRVIRPGTDIAPDSTVVDDILLQGRRDYWQAWNDMGEFARKRFTRGWWITVSIKPKIKILQRPRT